MKETTAQAQRGQLNQIIAVADPRINDGSFYSEELDVTYTITSSATEVFASVRGRKPVAMQCKGPDLFDVQMAGAEMRVRFERDSQGKVTGFSIDAGRVTHIRFTKK
jgi:hypothetical protein